MEKYPSKQLKDKDGKYYPVTHESAVVDENGNPISSKMGSLADLDNKVRSDSFVGAINKVASTSLSEAEKAAQSATEAATYITSLRQAIADLPDGQAVSEMVAEHTVQIDTLGSKVDGTDIKVDTQLNVGYISTNGQIAGTSSGSYFYSQPILLAKKSTFKGKFIASAGVAALSSFNNGSYTPLVIGISPNDVEEYSFSTDADMYVVASGLNKGGFSATIENRENGLIHKVEFLAEKTEELDNAVKNHTESLESFEGRLEDAEKSLADISGKKYIDISESFSSGEYVNKDGGISTFSSARIYEPIELLQGETMVFHARVGINIAAISIWEDSLYIPKVIGESSGEYINYTYTAEKDCMIVLSSAYDHTQDSVYVAIFTAEMFQEVNNLAKQTASKVYSISYALDNVAKVETRIAETSKSYGYVDASGNIKGKTSTNFEYIVFQATKGDIVNFITDASDSFSAIAEYFSDNEPCKPLIIGHSSKGEATKYKYVVEKDGFYAISGYKGIVSQNDVVINVISGGILKDVAEDVEALKKGTVEIDKFGLTKLSDNPVAVVKEGGFGSLIRSWGFIGDSMSSGETYGFKKGATSASGKDDYWLSWGQFMCRMFGSEGYNYSVGGETAKSWCTGSDNERRWDKLKTQKHEAYTIALGQNDHHWVNATPDDTSPKNYPCITKYQNRADFLNGTITISEDDVRADIDMSDYTSNANSYVGYYAGIIQRIKSANELGFIFLITNPLASVSGQDMGYKYYNDCIRHIHNIFKEIYPDTIWLIELDKYSRYKDIKTNIALNGLHFGAFGYKLSAMEIGTYIDWIIRNNINKFQSISMVLDEKKATKW